MARRWLSGTSSLPRRRLSTLSAPGAADAMGESFEQLDDFLDTLGDLAAGQ
jgi:hypothetical protein